MEYMYHVSSFIPTKGSLSPPNHLAKFRKVRADGLHRAAARGDAEVGHGAASPWFEWNMEVFPITIISYMPFKCWSMILHWNYDDGRKSILGIVMNYTIYIIHIIVNMYISWTPKWPLNVVSFKSLSSILKTTDVVEADLISERENRYMGWSLMITYFFSKLFQGG